MGIFVKKLCLFLVAVSFVFWGPSAYAEQGGAFHLGGYLREAASFNLGDPVETDANDRGDISMARSVLQLEADGGKDDIRFRAVGRLVGETKTNYLERLEKLGAADGDLMDEYTGGDLREFYLDMDLSERVSLRLGKQQVVWGESDFFQAMDVVHGLDFTWRSFLEPENEDWRKPLILANAEIDVPELKGALQLLLRPGLDRKKDIGSTFDLFGGRWANQPNKGVNFLSVLPYNFNHEKGDEDDPTYGVRWTGLLGPVNYSLAYLKTLGPVPVVNSAFAPYKSAPTGAIGELIYPETDLYGLTLSGYVPWIDAVLSTEVAYTMDQYYNVGSNFLGGALPGFGGIKKKDTVRSMLRMDINSVRWTQDLLKTSRPSFFSVQVFDTWLPQFDDDDDIVELAGFGARRREHTTMATAFLTTHYLFDRVNPQIAIGGDVTNGDYFAIPSVDFAFGDNWRFLVEADLFFPKHSKDPGEVERDTHLLGYFKDNDQLYLRITRQF